MSFPSLDHLNSSKRRVADLPGSGGTVEMIVARPAVDEREELESAEFEVGVGLVGDNYVAQGSGHTPDGSAHPEAQVTMMTSAAVDLVAGGDRSRWALAGDQLMVSLDLSRANAPAGTRFAVGSAVLEVSAKPHTGCAKFRSRFGIDAARWVNSDEELRLRGINLMVVQSGTITRGDTIVKL